MPAGNVNTVDRMQRLIKTRELIDEGKTVTEISTELAIPIATVNRYISYLDELKISDLGAEEVAQKRQELYLELIEAAMEARREFDKHKILPGGGVNAKRMFDAWMKTVELRQELFGLHNTKLEFTQINTLNQYNPPDRIDTVVGDKLSAALKKTHEQKVTDTYNNLEAYEEV